ncbi:MAG: triphosphoribosyl-dephospho-CoA synthase, partial [Candidatus Competibacteraceae bacterium]|nr:triphosphoribosyl-dephospho-CoA synthase [Candidatus Competibacteraceae bacterium]
VHRAGELDTGRVPGAVAGFVAELFADRLPGGTVGARVRVRYGAGGIVQEALVGLPAVFEVGLPALVLAKALGLDSRRSLWLAMARLMQRVEDTTALRRCGPVGLERLRVDGARLEALLLAGLDPVPFLVRTNDDYCRMRLTMGGVADLLGLCIAWDDCDRDLSAQDFEV